jgi:hypothetical protein
MRAEEALAKVCFDSLCAPRSLRHNRDQSNGEPDFDVLDGRGRRIGVLEVTRSMHEQYTRTFEAVLDVKRNSGRVDSRLCVSGWRVMPAIDARITQVRARLDCYLAEIEREGLSRFDPVTPSPAVRAIVNDLGVESGVAGEHEPGTHWINPPGMSAQTSPGAVNDAIRVEAAKPDNMRKLAQSDDAERHLFVCVEISSLAAHRAMQYRYEPDPVVLDAAISHVWAVCRTHALSARVWHALNAGPWQQSVVNWREPFD